MNGSAANKHHRESHDYDYDPLEVITYTFLMCLCLHLYFKSRIKQRMKVFYHWPASYLNVLTEVDFMMYPYDDLSNGDAGSSPKYDMIVN